jgi:hypothetical protein
LVLAALFSVGALVQPAHAREADGDHVRALDSRVRAAIAGGIEGSPLFRDLVAQLDASDVIVYVESDPLMPERLQGRLTFVSSAGGRRYVMVRIACAIRGAQQIAILGHELQHAVEIARAPSVVDEPSLAAEYRRIGFSSRVMRQGAGFDSRAAIEAGQRVWHEMGHRAE